MEDRKDPEKLKAEIKKKFDKEKQNHEEAPNLFYGQA